MLASRTIEAKPQALDRVFLKLHEYVAGERRSCGGRDGNGNPEPARCIDQFEQIAPGKRVASRQDQLWQRIAEVGDLLQKIDALIKREFHGMRRGQGLRPAMTTGERACLRHFPIDVQRRLGVIARRVMGS